MARLPQSYLVPFASLPPSSPTVPRRMLEKTRITRITLHGAMCHEWVTREGVWHPQWDDGQDVRQPLPPKTAYLPKMHYSGFSCIAFARLQQATYDVSVWALCKNRSAHVRYCDVQYVSSDTLCGKITFYTIRVCYILFASDIVINDATNNGSIRLRAKPVRFAKPRELCLGQ